MAPSGLFSIVLVVYLVITCLLGGLCGAMASRVLRLHWKAKLFIQDMSIAGIVWVVALFVITELEWQRLSPAERWDEHVNPWLFVFIGSVAPLVRHLIRFVSSHKDRAASPAK
jgi:hypothetical protein